MIVIASIHQPSTATFELFDRLLLLSDGQTCYNGDLQSIKPYFETIGNSVPLYVNPAEYLLDLTSADFSADSTSAENRITALHSAWLASTTQKELSQLLTRPPSQEKIPPIQLASTRPSFPTTLLTLLHRSLTKSIRDPLPYGIRVAMYLGLALMMATIWLRLPATQSSIPAFTTAIFFGSAFMSFMAVAYVPSYLEDRATFIKERANGLYGATAFTVANFLIGLPFLFLISVLFSLVVYWAIGLRDGGGAWLLWTVWLFLDLVAAESLVVLVSSLLPNFVVALAVTAFANGLWMSVGGFLVSPETLNPFWRYVFHYIDYVSLHRRLLTEHGGNADVS